MDIHSSNIGDDLCAACAAGDAERVSAIIAKITLCDLRSAIMRIDSALYLAVEGDQLAVVELLLCIDHSGAFREVILEGLNLAHPITQKTPLYLACRQGNAGIVEVLVAAGATKDVGLAFAAAYEKGYSHISQLLLKMFTNTEKQIMTPMKSRSGLFLRLLQYACHRCDMDMIALLSSHCSADTIVQGATRQLPHSSPLGIACVRKDYKMLSLLLRHGANVTASVLHATIFTGDDQSVSIVLANGGKEFVSISARFNFECGDYTPLELCSKLGYLSIIHLLEADGAESTTLAKSIEPQFTLCSCRELMFAIKNGHSLVAAHWLNQGARMNISSCNSLQIHIELGANMVQIAALYNGDNISIIVSLIDHGTHDFLSKTVTAKSYHDAQLFHTFAAEGIESPAIGFHHTFASFQRGRCYCAPAVATVMTKEQAIKTMQEDELIFEIIERRSDHTSVLIQVGVKLNLYDDVTVKTFHNNEKVIIETLIACNYDLNFPFAYCYGRYDRSKIVSGVTLLMIACNEVWPESVQQLLEAGADPNIKDSTVGYPLHWLVYNMYDVQQRQFGKGITDKAFEQGRAEIVVLLLQYGADPILPNDRNVTSLVAFKCYSKLRRIIDPNYEAPPKVPRKLNVDENDVEHEDELNEDEYDDEEDEVEEI